ncbi:hypothetical protein [Streptomyces sp. L-9-10]|uniref:hypothetical protein n=1 Tax=Streptomyces sp. L-9-10 TaxID=1478131 RepID=UPI0013EBE17F|nr:hypothetical protein [Streptomyces sp. L-9-10]
MSDLVPGVAALSAVLRAVVLVEPVADGATWALFPAAERASREFHGLRGFKQAER